MKLRPVLTIRSRLMLLVMACIVPASLMVAALIGYDYFQGRSQLIRESIAMARATMSTVDSELAGTQTALSVLATSPYLASGNLAAFQAQATGLLKSQHVVNIVLIDPGARQRQVVNTVRPFGSKMPAGVVPGLERAMIAGQPFVSDIFVGPIAQKHLLAVGVPVFRGDKVTYALAAGVLPERLLELLRRQRFPADWIVVIFDSRGNIVARTQLPARRIGPKRAHDPTAPLAEPREGHVGRDTSDSSTISSAVQ